MDFIKRTRLFEVTILILTIALITFIVVNYREESSAAESSDSQLAVSSEDTELEVETVKAIKYPEPQRPKLIDFIDTAESNTVVTTTAKVLAVTPVVVRSQPPVTTSPTTTAETTSPTTSSADTQSSGISHDAVLSITNPEPKPTEPQHTLIGTMKVTGYTHEEGFRYGKTTASGTGCREGICAMNNTRRKELGIRYGDSLYIKGLGTYQVYDCGCSYNTIDIWFWTNKEAYAITGYYEVYLVK